VDAHAARVVFVCTEAQSHLDHERLDRYERIRARLGAIARRPCDLVHYSDVASFDEGDVVVLSGSDAPWEAHPSDGFAALEEAVRRADVPMLGICAGMQLLTWVHGGAVEPLGSPGPVPEEGFRTVELLARDDPLLEGLGARAAFYESHSYEVTRLPRGFEAIAAGERCRNEAFRRTGRPVWGVQFHPEAADAAHPAGERLLANFFAAAAYPVR
jgi:GMP synthase-like glutamine amidotransferase